MYTYIYIYTHICQSAGKPGTESLGGSTLGTSGTSLRLSGIHRSEKTIYNIL